MFVGRFGIDLIIAENALTIPMYTLLGAALADFIEETGIPTIAYHHDSCRKRERFRRNNSVLDRPSGFDRSLSLIYNGAAPMELWVCPAVSVIYNVWER